MWEIFHLTRWASTKGIGMWERLMQQQQWQWCQAKETKKLSLNLCCGGKASVGEREREPHNHSHSCTTRDIILLPLLLPFWASITCASFPQPHSFLLQHRIQIRLPRDCHGYGFTCGVSEMGDAGMGTVTKIRHCT